MTLASGEEDDEAPDDSGGDAGAAGQRLDKWLWFTRMVKSRTLAAELVASGKIRVNRNRVTKPSHMVKVGDTITSAAQRVIRIVRVRAVGSRRGPASEAAQLYEELTPPPARLKSPATSEAGVESGIPIANQHGERQPGSGRPTKRERRQIDSLKRKGL